MDYRQTTEQEAAAVSTYSRMCKDAEAYVICHSGMPRCEPLARVLIQTTAHSTRCVLIVNQGGGVYSTLRSGTTYHDASLAVGQVMRQALATITRTDGSLKAGNFEPDVLYCLQALQTVCRNLIYSVEGGNSWINAIETSAVDHGRDIFVHRVL